MKILKFLGLALILLLVASGLILYQGDYPKDVIDARYTSPASQFLELREAGRIHYRDEGNRRAPAIVLLHGSNASLHTWEPWVARLGNDYRVISLDFPGHGLTGEVPTNDYSAEAYLKVVDAVAQHLKLDTFVLAGNSMGGGVAWRYALSNPGRLDGLVLIDSSVPTEWRANTEVNGEDNPVAVFGLLRNKWFRQIAQNLDPYYLAAQGVKAAYNNAETVNEALIMRYYDLNLRAGTRSATMARFSQLPDENKYDLSKIRTPTLIMWGIEDVLIPFARAQQLASVIPNASTAYYENVGHVPMEERPDESAEDLRMFLETLPIK